jgi:hypothetical protein
MENEEATTCICCGEKACAHLRGFCLDCAYLAEKRDFVTLGKKQEIAVEKGLISYEQANPEENPWKRYGWDEKMKAQLRPVNK